MCIRDSLIISGGYNVYPAEIEGVCNELPGVAETAVVGVPHADFGEAVVAVVVARAGATVDPDALTSALKAKIANFKVPKAVFVVSELPRNAMGKVQKLSLIHISEPTRLLSISYAVFCLKKKT